MHSRAPGDHTSVRWTDFKADGPPTMGYYWPENDPKISETDNLPTAYLPWKDWCWLKGMKIIDIGKQKPVVRNGDPATSEGGMVELTLIGSGTANMYHSNYNPACLMNPTDDFTVWFGGGYYRNYRGGAEPTIKLIADNPDFPAKSTKPIRVWQITYHLPSPIYVRNVSKVGDWVYWGGAGVDEDSNTRVMEFYRIHLPTLRRDLKVHQERLPDIPVVNPKYGGRFPLLAADEPRRRIIYVNHDGAFVYQIPADHGAKGVWAGPFTFDNWAKTVADGGDWYGVEGIHRTDLNQTFFRHNLSKKWNRIRWKN